MSKRFELAKSYTAKYGHLLKPCNNCGCSNNVIVTDRSMFLKQKYVWSVSCGNDCGQCVYGRNTVKDAIVAWNRLVSKNM